jgi:hypothetical protein
MGVDLSFDDDDLSLTDNGDIATINEGDQVVSHVSARIKMVLGEDYFDTTKGIPWFDAMYTPATSYEQKSAILRQTILRTPEVSRLVSFSYGVEPRHRLAIVEYPAETIYSTAISDEVVI